MEDNALNVWNKIGGLNPWEERTTIDGSGYTFPRFEFFSQQIIAGLEVLKHVFLSEKEASLEVDTWSAELHNGRGLVFRMNCVLFANTLYPMLGFLQKYNRDIANLQKTPEFNLEDIKIKNWIFWRNKVFAHPAAVNPKESDDLLLQSWTKVFWSGQVFGYEHNTKSLYFSGNGPSLKGGKISLKDAVNIIEDYPVIEDFF